MPSTPDAAPVTVEEREGWLRENGWIQAPNGTWGYPQSTCRSISTEGAYHLGQIIAELDNEPA